MTERWQILQQQQIASVIFGSFLAPNYSNKSTQGKLQRALGEGLTQQGPSSPTSSQALSQSALPLSFRWTHLMHHIHLGNAQPLFPHLHYYCLTFHLLSLCSEVTDTLFYQWKLPVYFLFLYPQTVTQMPPDSVVTQRLQCQVQQLTHTPLLTQLPFSF